MMHLHLPTRGNERALLKCRLCGFAIDPCDWVVLHNEESTEIPLCFDTMCASEFLFKSSLGAHVLGETSALDELSNLHHSLTLYVLLEETKVIRTLGKFPD